jgi:hypothetical protein
MALIKFFKVDSLESLIYGKKTRKISDSKGGNSYNLGKQSLSEKDFVAALPSGMPHLEPPSLAPTPSSFVWMGGLGHGSPGLW